MAINTTLATLSDQAFGAAAAAYTVGLVCAAVEFASSKATRSPVAAATTSDRVAVGVGPAVAGAVLTRDGSSDGVPLIPTAGSHVTGIPLDGPLAIGRITAEKRAVAPWGERFGQAGLVVTGLGLVANLVSIVTRGVAAGRLPLGNLFEFSSVICATVVTVWLVLKIRDRSLTIGAFVLAPVILLMFVAGLFLHIPVADVPPALKSYWKWIHVTAMVLSSSVLLFSGMVAALYVVRRRAEERGRIGGLAARLPASATLDRVAYRTAILAFPLYTFAVITGALWAEVAWGRYWGWDPKETCAFITWVVYAGYLHARSTAGWRGMKAAWISVFGLVTIVFNLFVVNLVVSGLHSYAGPGLN